MTSCSSQWRAECEKWALMDIYSSKIRTEALNKHKGHNSNVCACRCWEDCSSSHFYEWREGICHFFTIFGHSVVQWRESFVYAARNLKKCGSEAKGRNSPTLPSSQIYCDFMPITHGFVVYCCKFEPRSAKFVWAAAKLRCKEPHPAGVILSGMIPQRTGQEEVMQWGRVFLLSFVFSLLPW